MADYSYDRVAARLDDLERPAQDVVNMCKQLYMLIGRIEERAKTMQQIHPREAVEVLRRIPKLDTEARKMYRDLVEGLGLG